LSITFDDKRRCSTTLKCAAIASCTPRNVGLRKDEFTPMEFFVGISVRSLAGALDWYKRLLGREPDLLDGDHAAVWDLAEGRSLYIQHNPEHAGHVLFTMYFDDLDAVVSGIAERGIEPARQGTNAGNVRMFTFQDPDGNEIDFGWYPH
jgi:catechol 2,3-dioxygenase-like lactoylglutathione lyase family enzyme